MNFCASLLLPILTRAEDFEWSLQGFGMLRMYITPEVRLHLWNPHAAYPGVTRIHNHPWDFESHVICGSMLDRLYRTQDWSRFAPTHREERIVCGPGGHSEGAKRTVRLVLKGERRVSAGESYTLKASELHESLPEPGTATIIVRTFKTDTEHALVYPQVERPWVSAEPRPATKEEVRAFADLTLRTLEAESC